MVSSVIFTHEFNQKEITFSSNRAVPAVPVEADNLVGSIVEGGMIGLRGKPLIDNREVIPSGGWLR